MGACAAQLFERDVLTGDLLDDSRASDEHLGGLVDHNNEVSEGRRVDVASGRRTHDDGDLGDNTGGPGVAAENITEAGQGGHSLLDACAAALIDADKGTTSLDGEVNDFADFLAVDFAEGSAEDSDVLAEYTNRATMDRADTGDDPVGVRTFAVHAEVR